MGNDCLKTDILITKQEINSLSDAELQIISENYILITVQHLNEQEIEERTNILIKSKCGSRVCLPQQTIRKLQGYQIINKL